MSQPSESTTGLDAAFLARQKARLEALRDQLVAEADAAGSDERRLQDESIDEVRDNADSAETVAMQENDEATYRRNIERLKYRTSEGDQAGAGEDRPGDLWPVGHQRRADCARGWKRCPRHWTARVSATLPEP